MGSCPDTDIDPKFENAKNTGHFGFVFEEKLGLWNLEISVMSSCVQNVSVPTETKKHRFQISQFAERF